MKTGAVTAKPLVTVGPRDFARHAEGLMDDFGLTVLPVVDRGVFLGIVTKASCLRGKPGEPAPKVEQLMTQPTLTAGPEMDAADLYTAMTLYEVVSVPVLHDGQVVGVLTRRDVLEAISHEDPHLRAGRAHRHG